MVLINLGSEEEPKVKVKSRDQKIGAIVLIAAVVLVGLVWGALFAWKVYAEGRVKVTNESIAAVKSETDQFGDVKGKAALLESQLASVDRLLVSHQCFSSLFRMLEDNTVKDVAFTDFKSDEKNSTITLMGKAADYASAGEQIAVFRSLPQVSSVAMSQARLTADRESKKSFVEFDMTLGIEKLTLLCSSQAVNQNTNTNN